MPRATPDPKSKVQNPKSPDFLCVALLLLATLGVYAPSLFGGRVLLPADIVPIMRPWAAEGRTKFADHPFAHNQMHGPIFEYYSWRHYARERVREGEVPLWNPYELSGNVLLANSQSAVLYPPNALLYLFPLPVGINLVTALHTFLTGLFLFGLVRLWRLAPVAALTSALAWMFCGVQMAWIEFQTPTAVLCWLPALLWSWEMFARRGSVRVGLVGGAVGVTLTLLAGHLHFGFYVLLAYGLYALIRTVIPALLRREMRSVGVFVGALGLGIALSACTILPVVEMARMNFRAGKTDYASSIGLRLPPQNLLTLVQPNLFGSPRDYYAADLNPPEGWAYWGAFDYIEYACYLGIPALVLALFGATRAFRRRAEDDAMRFPARFFGGLSLLGLLLALGTPVCALFFYGLPGYGQFNATARALCLFCFGMAALAGIGLQALLSSPAEEKGAGRAFGLTLAIVILAGLAAFPGMGLVHGRMLSDHWIAYESSNLRHFVIFAALTGLLGWLLLRGAKSGRFTRMQVASAFPALAVLDLLVVYAGFNPQIDPAMLGYPTATTTFLQGASPGRIASLEEPGRGIKSFIVPNYNAVAGLREVQGADSLHTKKYHQLMERVVLGMEPQRGAAFSDPNTVHVPKITHPLFDLLNVRYVTTLPDSTLVDPTRLRRVTDAELTIWENPKALGPAWVVGSAEKVDGLDGFLARLNNPAFDARNTALLSADPPPLDPAASGSPVRLTGFSPHRLTLEVEARGNGLLILSEIAFPGWRARVDGRPVPVQTADHILRSVPVSAGAHKVEVDYRPSSYLVGLYLTCISLAACTALILWLRTGPREPI